jgi:ubiquinone/menaquinone biosynthesis C-methylase UbiE
MSMATPDYSAIKTRQQAMWATGDFSEIGSRLAVVGETLCESVDLLAGSRVLDIACGSGATTIPAARRFADVVGLDYVPALLERGREIAAAERLDATFVEGDAENLPFEDGAFDTVLSSFGVMFAPDHAKAASEVLRVCRSGGIIGVANWCPDGFIGSVFGASAPYAPLPPGLQPPARWGTEDGIRDLFGEGVRDLRFTRRTYTFRFRSEDHWIEFFRTYFGPIARIFASLDRDGASAFEEQLRAAIRRFNRRPEGPTAIEADYLETIAIRR